MNYQIAFYVMFVFFCVAVFVASYIAYFAQKLAEDCLVLIKNNEEQRKDFIQFLTKLHEPRINESLQRAYERGLVQEKVKLWSS